MGRALFAGGTAGDTAGGTARETVCGTSCGAVDCGRGAPVVPVVHLTERTASGRALTGWELGTLGRGILDPVLDTIATAGMPVPVAPFPGFW